MKWLVCFVIILQLGATASFAKDAEETFYSIRSPEQLTSWFSNDFIFQWKFPDKPQTLEETLRSKAGDCEDFANLASAVLKQMGIPNQILILKFRNLKIAHAICIWQDTDGLYSFISNQELFHTRKDNIKQAIKKFYPDCETIIKRRAPVTYLP